MKSVTFIRIPKNASTSIYAFLGDANAVRNERFCANNPKYLNIFEPSHCTLSDAISILGDDLTSNPILAVVRNPYDRLVSMFFFAKKYNLGAIYGIDTERFDLFAEQFYDHSHDPNFFHATSQMDFIAHDGCAPQVCRFERLDDDIESFIERNDMGDQLSVSALKKLNGTEHSDYRDYYSENSRAIVEKMWGDDLEHFSYTFVGD